MESRPAKRNCLGYEPETASSWGETGVDQDVFSFLWTINNCSTMIKLGEVKSPLFRGGLKNNYDWLLKMYQNVEDQDYISLYLWLVNSGNEDSHSEDEDNEDAFVKAHLQFAILNADGRLVKERESKIREFSKHGDNRAWGYKNYCKSTDLLNPESNYMVDGTVKILCKVWIYGEAKATLRNGSGAKFNPSHDERIKMSKFGIVNDLGKIFKESIGTDVTISGSKTNYKAHKAILIARSPVFAAMFNADMLESRANFVQITDFEDDVVKGMLEHLYTGETECMGERAPELLRIAEKYDLSGLKAECEYELGDKLNLDNAGEILVLAVTNNSPDLKSRALNFIKKNKEALLKTKPFQDALKLADAGTLAELYLSQP